MNSFLDKTPGQEGHKQSSLHSESLKDGIEGITSSQFVDNRPEALQMRRMNESINNSPRVSQMKSRQEMINNSPRMRGELPLFTNPGPVTPVVQQKEDNEAQPICK